MNADTLNSFNLLVCGLSSISAQSAIVTLTNSLMYLTAKIEQRLRYDRYMHRHYRYYVREMRVIAYTQLLESYQSLTIEYMANAFGVTEAFVDQYVYI